MRRSLTAVLVFISVVAGTLAESQPDGQPPTRLSFEVASVKPSHGDTPMRRMVENGRFTFTNVTLKMLIAAAYGEQQPLPDYRIIGGPDWLNSDRFDVLAKTSGDATSGPVWITSATQAMLRRLLEERFRLHVRDEKRETAIFALVLASKAGKLGRSMSRNTTGCETGADGHPRTEPCSGYMANGKVEARGVTLSQLARALAGLPYVGRPVVDRTGLSGAFDINLTWTPDRVPQPETPTTFDLATSSIFTALQAQLGLKLEPTKGPVDVVVIDHVEKPTPD